MNGAILIRDGKVAFATRQLDRSSGVVTAYDMSTWLVPDGLFIPFSDVCAQAISIMDASRHTPIVGSPKSQVPATATSGVLTKVIATEKGYRVSHFTVGFTEEREIYFLPILVGPAKGSAVVSLFAMNTDILTTCDRLSKNIEDAVRMYCKHSNCIRQGIQIWTDDDFIEFFRQHDRLPASKVPAESPPCGSSTTS